MKIETLVQNILATVPGEEAAAPLLATLATALNPETGQAWGQDAIATIVEGERKKAREKRERNAKKAEKARRRKALETLEADCEGLDILEPDTVLEVAAKVVAAGGSLAIDGEGNFSIVGLKVSKSGGNNGGGRIAADAPSGYLDSEGNVILGPLTTWAKATFSEQELRDMGCYTPQSNKFRTGSQLAKALGDKVSVDPNPVLESDDSDDGETETEGN